MDYTKLTDAGVKALIELRAMEEANAEREEQGHAHAYGSDAFFALSDKLVPYGEVSISPEAAEALKSKFHFGRTWPYGEIIGAIDSLTKGADE